MAIGYHLGRQGRRFVILEAADGVAAAWRKRWDSLTLFTPRRYSALPGLELPGDPDGYPTRDEIVEYLGHTSMFQDRVSPPTDPDLPEVVVRYAARCPDAENARKVFTESVPLYNNGPAGVAGVGTRPPLKELYAIWPCLIPREHVVQSVELLEV